MLLYHPIYDIFHCVYRMLRILSVSHDKTMKIEQIRILDFYLLFPSQIRKMTLPKQFVHFRKYITDNLNPYNDVDDEKLVFNRMEHYQLTALRCLASHNLIDPGLLNNDGLVKPTLDSIPKDLKQDIEKKNTEDSELIEFLVKSLLEIVVSGNQGLKARTRLLEYKYDPT